MFASCVIIGMLFVNACAIAFVKISGNIQRLVLPDAKGDVLIGNIG